MQTIKRAEFSRQPNPSLFRISYIKINNIYGLNRDLYNITSSSLNFIKLSCLSVKSKGMINL